MTTPTRIAIVNARIWTGNARRPWAEAILMANGEVELVGSSAEVRKRLDTPTQTVDARGMLAMPGWAREATTMEDADLLLALEGALSGAPRGTITVLQPGAPANLVILDRDITRAGPGDAGHAEVLMRIEAGRVVTDRAGLV